MVVVAREDRSGSRRVWIHEERESRQGGPGDEVVVVARGRGLVGNAPPGVVVGTSHTPSREVDGSGPEVSHTRGPPLPETGDTTTDSR